MKTLDSCIISQCVSQMWIGIGGLINDFRQNTLDLPSIHPWQAPSIMTDEKVPHTYCWSPSLVPKPADWPFYIDVSGFFFLDIPPNKIEPPADLLAFLGLQSKFDSHAVDVSTPIFIGFGSITGHDSRHLLKIILAALAQTGYRALLTGFDTDDERLPKTIFKVGNISHDWLFQHGECNVKILFEYLKIVAGFLEENRADEVIPL